MLMHQGQELQKCIVKTAKTDGECCGLSFLKYLLYIFNLILLFSGLIVLATGLFSFFVTYRYTSLLHGKEWDYFFISIYAMICAGAFVLLIVFIIGCCAICNSSKCCLMLYSFFLLIIFMLEVGAGIMAYIYEVFIKHQMSLAVTLTVGRSYAYNSQVRDSINHLQETFRCCGSKSYMDWEKSEWKSSFLNIHNASVPDSCCKTIIPSCGVNIHPSNINFDGCEKLFEGLIHEQLTLISGVGLGICGLQIFGIVTSCCLAKRIKYWKMHEYNNYWQ